MSNCDTLIRNASVIDGNGAGAQVMDVALCGDRIHAIGPSLALRPGTVVEGEGLALAPGFIDVHTHDDISVIRTPMMKPKISQGVTTVIVGNCGISASPVRLRGEPPDPMNLLGAAADFRYPTFSAYIAALRQAVTVVADAAQRHLSRPLISPARCSGRSARAGARAARTRTAR